MSDPDPFAGIDPALIDPGEAAIYAGDPDLALDPAYELLRRRLAEAVKAAYGAPTLRPYPFCNTDRGHTAEDAVPGLTATCREHYAAMRPKGAADPELACGDAMEEQWGRAMTYTAACLAAMGEYGQAKRVVAAGRPAPGCDADWALLAVRVGLPGVRDRVLIADAATAAGPPPAVVTPAKGSTSPPPPKGKPGRKLDDLSDAERAAAPLLAEYKGRPHELCKVLAERGFEMTPGGVKKLRDKLRQRGRRKDQVSA